MFADLVPLVGVILSCYALWNAFTAPAYGIGPFHAALGAVAAYAQSGALSRRRWSKKTQHEYNNRVSFAKAGLIGEADNGVGQAAEDTGMPFLRYNELRNGQEGATIRVPWMNGNRS